ncbi:MAG: helicase-related protein [Rhodothermales bacterium]
MTDFAIGSLVHARGREWVVLPESQDELLVLRPLGGTDDEITGLDTLLEDARSATFALPDPARAGDFRSARMLYDAVRLGFRASAGPFRSFASLGVEPRSYQLVPLLMALKMDPVRLLIADDVGIGKTVESGLIAKELLARGDAGGLTVLCPPQLAEQWQRELAEKFHIEAELVLPSTARRLEKFASARQSIFEVFPYTVVSMDYVKSDRRRDEFVRSCPDLVIVDEAHTCAQADGRGAQHQRHELVKKLAEGAHRHLILVTATPHSGKEEAFRSLLTLLDTSYVNLPADLTGPSQEPVRRKLAGQFVQRRRADIKHFADEDTPFPTRIEVEESEGAYTLTPEYATLFNDVLDYTRESVGSAESGSRDQRVRWWSALSLLRALASSPAAAAATLTNRAASAEAKTVAEADAIGRHRVMDMAVDDDAEGADLVHGALVTLEDDTRSTDQARLRALARRAEALGGTADAKLTKGISLVKRLLKDGHQPIVFCRFIQTAEYVAEALRTALRGVEVAAVTGLLAPTEREARVAELAQADKRVLVATDCLSEGINLQEAFDAVLHYDLAWNPTRHEQREGRVDRYGQPRKEVRVVTLFGKDNQIDGLVLDVLLRKHKTIRSQLGISVPVPTGSDALVEAVFEGLVLRGARVSSQQMGLFDDLTKEQFEDVHTEWEESATKETRSRTMFAQERIKTDDVVRELEAIRSAIGGPLDVRRFVTDAIRTHGGVVAQDHGGEVVRLDLTETPRSLQDAVGGRQELRVRFEGPVDDGEVRLVRTHPFVEGLASHVLDAALDGEGVARRSGVVRTQAVTTRTTVLLVRFRFHLVVTREGEERAMLAEDVGVLGFQGAPSDPTWLPEGLAAASLSATPDANIGPDQARHFLQRVTDEFDALRPKIEAEAKRRGDDLLDAHRRVRDAAKATGRYTVQHQDEPDVLGVFILLPAA